MQPDTSTNSTMPEPQQPMQPVSQPPIEPPVAPQPAAPSAPVEYQSNPFLVSLSGLVTLIKVNPIASLIVGLYGTLLVLGTIIVGAILTSIVPILGAVVITVGLLVTLALTIGAAIALADRSMKGETTTTGELFNDASKKLMPLIGATILVSLTVVIGLILLVIPGLIFAAWFSLTYFVIFHENLGVIAAMKRSRELVKGHVWEMLGATFAGSLISGSGSGLIALATGIAPFSGRYQQLTALKASGQPSPKTHWLNYFVPIVVAVLVAVYVAIVSIASINGVRKASNPYDFNNFNSNYNINTDNNLNTDNSLYSQ